MTFAVSPRYRVPQEEIGGEVPTFRTGGRLISSIVRVSLTQCPSESHTSSVIDWLPSVRQGSVWFWFAMNREELLDTIEHEAEKSPSILLAQLYVSSSKSRSQLCLASKTISLPLEYSDSSDGESQRMNGGWLLSSTRQKTVESPSNCDGCEVLCTSSYVQPTYAELVVDQPWMAVQRSPINGPYVNLPSYG